MYKNDTGLLLCYLYELYHKKIYFMSYHNQSNCRPRWLSWMRHPTGDHKVAGSTPAEVGNIEIDSEIFSTVILSLLLIQEGQL